MEKKFERPELIIITFTNDDIITTSGEYDSYTSNGQIGEDNF